MRPPRARSPRADVLDPLLRAVVPPLAVLREDPRGRLLGLRHLQPHVPAGLLRRPGRGVLGAPERRDPLGRRRRADRRDHGPGRVGVHEPLTCRDLTKCAVGQGKYVLITAEDGGIVNDPVLLRVEENRWWLALADSDAGLWARGVAVHSGLDVTVREPEVHPVQVQGPKSKDVIRTLFGDAVADSRTTGRPQTELDGIPVVISRTGWTGEVGYEIYLRDPSRGGDLWDRIMEAGRPHDIRPIAPCEARRIEAGIFNYGSDMTIENNPFEVSGPRAARRAAGGRLHRQGGARADPGRGRVAEARRASRSRATRCRSRSPRSGRRSTTARTSGRSPT